MKETVAMEYFPGGNTPLGFYSYYSCVMDPQRCKCCIILKGGPGTGKSTLMKRIADRLIEDGYTVEYLHCSSDPDSLDAVVCRELDAWIVDGTSPHTQDPIYPGAVEEIINLGAYWDSAKIAGYRDDIILTQAEISANFAQAYRYLAAAQKLSGELEAAYQKSSSVKLLQPIVDELLKPSFHTEGSGKVRKAFLSAITPKGLTNYIDSFFQNATKSYVLQTENTFLGTHLMNQLAAQITASGTQAILFYCAMAPETKIEHIYLPDSKTFYTISNSYHSAMDSAGAQIIALDTLTNTNTLPASLISDRKTYSQLIDNAIDAISHAKHKHDLLETYYSPAMDFSPMDALIEEIVQKFEA